MGGRHRIDIPIPKRGWEVGGGGRRARRKEKDTVNKFRKKPAENVTSEDFSVIFHSMCLHWNMLENLSAQNIGQASLFAFTGLCTLQRLSVAGVSLEYASDSVYPGPLRLPFPHLRWAIVLVGAICSGLLPGTGLCLCL